MALPLVSVPYLIDVIGSAHYGAYSISYTLLQYVLLIGAFGFSTITTKKIAENKDDCNKISKIFYSTIVARILLTIIACIFILFIVLSLFPQYLTLYILGLGVVFGDILNPVWLFQGMQDMKYMTIVNAISKIIFTLLIFLIINDESDYIYITLLNSAGFIVSGLISYFLAIKKFNIQHIKISIYDIKEQVKDASIFFLSSAFVNLYNNSFVFILGLFLNEASVGVYAAVEKIIKAAKSMIEPVTTALFPHVAKTFSGNLISNNVKIIFKYSKVLLILLSILTIIIFVLSKLLCKWFLGTIAIESSILIRIMSPLIIIGGLNYMLGVVGLVNLGLQKQWFKILLISSVISIIVLLVSLT